MVMCKTVCKINDLKKNSGALHLVGCHSHCERELIMWRWRSSKGRRPAFVDSSFLSTFANYKIAFFCFLGYRFFNAF